MYSFLGGILLCCEPAFTIPTWSAQNSEQKEGFNVNADKVRTLSELSYNQHDEMKENNSGWE